MEKTLQSSLGAETSYFVVVRNWEERTILGADDAEYIEKMEELSFVHVHVHVHFTACAEARNLHVSKHCRDLKGRESIGNHSHDTRRRLKTQFEKLKIGINCELQCAAEKSTF